VEIVSRWPSPKIVFSAMAVGAVQVVGSFGAAHNNGGDRKGMDALAIVLVLLGPLALAVRDRWPLGALAVALGSSVVYVGLGYTYGPIFLSVVVGLVYAVLRGRRRGAWLLASAGFVGYVAASQVDPRADHRGRLVAYALVAAWMIVALVVGELIRSRRDVLANQATMAAEAKQRRDSEQRLLLAQELHDVLAHHISLINVQAGVALHLMDEQPERVRPALTAITVASREAVRELRGALDVLRRGEAAPRSPAPTLADLDRLVAAVRASGLDVRLDEGPRPDPLPAAVELAAYRIVQEALTNVSRHAAARSATVRLRYGADVVVEVADDGVGGAPAVGNGITGMRERAAALGGELVVGPAPGGGFHVLARLPVETPVRS